MIGIGIGISPGLNGGGSGIDVPFLANNEVILVNNETILANAETY